MAVPTVIMKAALTLDGNLAAADGSSQWITGPDARRDAHEVRATVDAVMVGAGTLLADDPLLTVRLDGYDGPQPRPVIVAGRRPLPAGARLLGRDPIVVSAQPVDGPGLPLVVPDASGERVDLAAALAELSSLGIGRLLVEGGAGLLRSLLQAELLDEGILYYGAMLGGGLGMPLFTGGWPALGDARPVRIDSARLIGGDVRVDVAFTRPGR
jgi:diaminohydroxyphosphoribosylaminopyrimidine deaminase/5-amino-6-(5-phosphoribosylamino)uracil reductase